jgi:hypothetical protein
MIVNENQLSLLTRLRDGGAVFFAPQGVSIPRDQQDPQVIQPDYLVIRPGRPIQQLPDGLIALLKPDTKITAIRDEWIITDKNGPQRYLPPDQLAPLLRDSERQFTNLIAIDGRGRWLFRPDPIFSPATRAATMPATAPADLPTLILDPTIPDPSPRLAMWLIDSGTNSGWNKDNWPVFATGNDHWIVTERQWEHMADTDAMLTEPPLITPNGATTTPDGATTTPAESTTNPATPLAAASATEPALSTDLGPLLAVDPAGNLYYDGINSITMVKPSGTRQIFPLPPDCIGSGDRPWLVITREGLLFLFNSPGKVIRLRATPDSIEPLAVDALFTRKIPQFETPKRIWLDPAGRISIAYSEHRLAILFPTGQIPPEIADKMLAQDVRISEPDIRDVPSPTTTP